MQCESDDVTAVGDSREEASHSGCGGCWGYHKRVWSGNALQQRRACQSVSSGEVSSCAGRTPGEGEGSWGRYHLLKHLHWVGS